MNVIDKVFNRLPSPISGMITRSQADYILKNLNSVLNLEGDVVELGCNVGTTTLYISMLLEELGSDKKIHVYDSFQGLPEKHDIDNKNDGRLVKGSCWTSLEKFKTNMETYNQKLPEINVGWFKEIDDNKYPERICFAFFDGDFYTSILDSFEKVYHKMVPGGIILIHDYEWEHLPGVKVACDEFLKDKPEEIMYEGNCVAKMVKI